MACSKWPFWATWLQGAACGGQRLPDRSELRVLASVGPRGIGDSQAEKAGVHFGNLSDHAWLGRLFAYAADLQAGRRGQPGPAFGAPAVGTGGRSQGRRKSPRVAPDPAVSSRRRPMAGRGRCGLAVGGGVWPAEGQSVWNDRTRSCAVPQVSQSSKRDPSSPGTRPWRMQGAQTAGTEPQVGPSPPSSSGPAWGLAPEFKPLKEGRSTRGRGPIPSAGPSGSGLTVDMGGRGCPGPAAEQGLRLGA